MDIHTVLDFGTDAPGQNAGSGSTFRQGAVISVCGVSLQTFRIPTVRLPSLLKCQPSIGDDIRKYDG